MIEIISHRGYWKKGEEKNQAVAFEHSFNLGFGTETDFRDYNGKLVISHDIADAYSVNSDEFFGIHAKCNSNLPLAINVKADGLQTLLKSVLSKFNISNYFVFDMSVPDALLYLQHDFVVYSRQSEHEKEPAFYDKCAGIWLDAFVNRWYDADLIRAHITHRKKVAIVSFDLHKRDPIPLWQYLKDNRLHECDDVMLCTDIPEDALSFFNS
ncbi:MAG: hypothetical protein WKF66_13050 [Pedobacter sp.]